MSMFVSLVKSLAIPVEALLALYLHCVTVSEPSHHAPRFFALRLLPALVRLRLAYTAIHTYSVCFSL
jgi:hypothetical protein